ncbi:MAG: MYG1 family protein [bacterium]|nr:MYG1 family protein [bacterium]
MKIVTHNAKFHTDDVFAIATLLILYPDAEIIRTRDEELIKTADIVTDVGGMYDAENNHFDHHQSGGAGKRENGIQYASFGLVWKKFGEEISSSREVAEKIDNTIAQLVDAADNGQDVILSTIPELFPFTVNGIIDQYRPTWKEEQNWDERFMEAVRWAQSIIKREVKILTDTFEGTKVIETLYKDSVDKRVFVIDKKYDFGRETVMNTLIKFPEPIYAVLYRGDTQSWQVLAIKKGPATFESRKALPEAWRAKKDAEFEAASGVSGALFCHRSGFMCTTKSQEGALKLAQIALNS